MALRAKGLNLDFSGFRQANALIADTGRVQGEGLMRLGAGIGAGVQRFRSDREKATDKARANARADRAEAREDDRIALVRENQQRDDDYRRDKDALAWLETQHKGAFGQLQEIMLHGQVTPELQDSDAWKSARAMAASRERDLAGKVATVRARLSGMRPEDVTTPEPVQPTYDLGIGGDEEPEGETDEARVARLAERAGRLRKMAAGSKGAASVLYGGLAAQAEAELGLAKQGIAQRGRDAVQAKRAAADRDASMTAADDFLGMIPARPDWAGVPGAYKAKILGALQNSREGARFGIQDAIREMDGAARGTKQAATIKGEGRATEKQAESEALGVNTPKEAQASAGRKQSQEALDKAMERIEARSAGVDTFGKPIAEDLGMIRLSDALMLRDAAQKQPGVVPPKLLDLVTRRLDAARKSGEWQDQPAAAQSVGAAPAREVAEAWERGPDGKLRRVR